MTPPNSIVDRVSQLLGERPRSWSQVAGGYTPAARWVLQLNRSAVFAKMATTPLTAQSLRREFYVYERVKANFIPRVIAWEDHPQEPLLVIEDMSLAYWPPPWDRNKIDEAVACIAQVHATSAPDILTYDVVHRDRTPGWHNVAADPAPFLALGLVTTEWLSSSLAAILDAENACNPHGVALTHLDIRSDNMCFGSRGFQLIDWSEACLSNPDIDLGFWLPSLAFEGGPMPEEILPGRPEIAAWVSGFFASRAGLPIVPKAPRVRTVQREQLSAALPWLCRALKLKSP
jgi:aminoglycoside phosphotransferase (APT) family kinase protein